LIAARTENTAPRAGTLALSLLAVPLNVAIVEALAKKSKSLVALRRAGGSPPTTTMQMHLRTLARAGVLEPRGKDSFSGVAMFGLTPAGHGLVGLASVVRAWLAAAPEGELELGTVKAGRMTTVLVDGWSAGIVRLLAARPLSGAELGSVLRAFSRSALEKQLTAMRRAGLIEAAPGGDDDEVRYQPTTWLRRAIAPLAAAASWEQMYGLEGASPITRLEIESAFLLSTPLVRLPRQLSGTCRLVVEVQAPGGSKHAGAFVTVGRGRITSCVTLIQGQADSWVSGCPTAWLRAVIDGDAESLDVVGGGPLPAALLDGLHTALFGSPAADRPA
jgi:DNA-binding HxlR family transcriptional regulator